MLVAARPGSASQNAALAHLRRQPPPIVNGFATMTGPLDHREREALCDLLLELGPDAPTLCAGWTTAHLAAHLVLRERFTRWTEEKVADALDQGYDALVAQVRRPPPIPWQVPGIRRLNALEYVIHHEDVRRANGRPPRTGVPDVERLSWRVIGLVGKQAVWRLRPVGLSLHRPDGTVRQFGTAPFAHLHGQPLELLLYLAGRKDAAQITVSGDTLAVEALEAANLSL